MASKNSVIPRTSYVPPPGFDTLGLMNILNEYFDKTKLNENFSHAMHDLLNGDLLPYNPYPHLVAKLRCQTERFVMFADSNEHIDKLTTNPLVETSLLNLYTLKSKESVFGLKSVLRIINVHSILKYRFLSLDITPSVDDLFTINGYSSQVLVAMVGPAVFNGVFYSECHIVQFRIEFLVTGSDASQGITIFVNSIILDIEKLMMGNIHILLGVNVPVESEGKLWIEDFWDPKRVARDKGTLFQLMRDAAVASKAIRIECVFNTDPLERHYTRGQKQYSLNFISVNENNKQKERVLSFAEFPMGSLHEGIFFSQTQAEAYMNIFTPQTNHADVQNVKHVSLRSNVANASDTERITLTRPSMVYEDDRTLVHRHVLTHIEQLKPTKIRIDGFHVSGDIGFGPFAWQITSPIKAHLQSCVASFSSQTQLFEIVYDILLLVLMDRTFYNQKVVYELYRVYHSTARRLHTLNEENKSLRAIIRGLIESNDTQLVRTKLMQYKDNVNELLSRCLQTQSNEMIMIGRAIVGKVEQMLEPDDRYFGSITHIDYVVATLREIHQFSLPLLVQLSEDALHWCPQLQDLIAKFCILFPEQAQDPEPSNQTKNFFSDGFDVRKVVYRHGKEDDRFMKHEDFVIIIQHHTEKNGGQEIAASGSALLKYIVDTHLDEVWHTFLVNVMTDLPLIQNPYPPLLSTLRGSAMRMDLCFETKSALADSLLATKLELADERNYIYRLPGCKAFGLESALHIVDIDTFIPMYTTIDEHLKNTTYIQRKGPYSVAVCLGITSPTTVYGKLSPYLYCIELHEHYYIQGPVGHEFHVLQLFTKIVQTHISELIERGNFPIVGMIMGHEKIRWSWSDIINQRHNFCSEMEMMCARSEPIYMKAFVKMDEWRYVMTRKHFLLHFMSDDGVENVRYYRHSTALSYETLFFSCERAGFSYQNDGLPRGGNPFAKANCNSVLLYLNEQILQAFSNADWFMVHRYSLLKAFLMKEGVSSATVEMWRLCNSVAGRSMYVASLCESLQDICLLAFEYNHLYGGGHYSTDEVDSRFYLRRNDSQNEYPIDEEVVNKMVLAFKQKAISVASSSISLMTSSISTFVNNTLNSIIKVKDSDQQVYLAIDNEAIHALEELRQVFLYLAVITGGDVYSFAAHAQACVGSAKTGLKKRPVSVNSHQLLDPDHYCVSRPAANTNLLDDDVLYLI